MEISLEEKEAIERAKFLVSIPTYLEKEMCKNLLNYIDKLQKENEHLRDVKNKAIGHINCCKTFLGNYVISPSEAECLLDILKEE